MPQNRFNRRSIRLPGYDYSQPGMYFVTICVRGKECLLGDVANGEMELSEAGKIVQAGFQLIPKYYSHINVNYFVVMPNHIHSIIEITNRRGVVTTPLQTITLGKIVAYYKYQTTKNINHIFNTPGLPFWQRNYYERIIRNENELNNIRQYISKNPLRWAEDEENPENSIKK